MSTAAAFTMPGARRPRSPRIVAAAAAALSSALLAPAASAQPSAWQSFTCADCIAVLDVSRDAVWAGTFTAGIVRHDLADGTWRRFTRADGLAYDSVGNLVVGPDGDVWAAVYSTVLSNQYEASIAHYDGAAWTSFNKDVLPGVERIARPSPLAAGPGGAGLVALNPGANGAFLARYDGSSWHLDGAAAGLSAFVSAAAFDRSGVPWLVAGPTLMRFALGRWTAVPSDRPVPADVRAIAVAADGTVFVATPAGVDRYREAGWPEGGHWRHDWLPSSTAASYRLYVDTSGAVASLLATNDGWADPFALRTFDGLRWLQRPVPHLERKGTYDGGYVPRARTAALGRDGMVWTGYVTEGLVGWDGVRLTRRLTHDGPPSILTSSVTIGPDRRVWVGSYGVFSADNVLSVFDGTRWQRLNSADGVPVASTPVGLIPGGIEVGPDGDVWANFDDAVGRFDGRRWTRYTARDGLPSGRISDLAADGSGGVWAVGYGGTAYFDGAHWRRVPQAEAAVPGIQYAVAVDRRPGAGAVWVGGATAARFDGQRWRAFGAAEGMPDVMLADAAIDASGNAWFSSDGGPVIRCDELGCTSIGAPGLPARSYGFGIALDHAGRPWIGASLDVTGAGLYHFDGAAWRRYPTADGLLDEAVFDVAIDDAGRVWAATIAGISVLTPADAVPAPPIAPPPAPTPLPGPESPKVCPQIDGRVPPAAVNAALAAPASLDGWLQPANPNRPVGPFNARRTWLTLRQSGAAYHPIANGLVWRAECP